MKKMCVLVLLVLFTVVLSSCTSNEKTASFDSFLLSDAQLVEEFKSQNHKFAVVITKSDEIYTQTFYIWNNELRRTLRDELIILADQLDLKSDKMSLFQTQFESDHFDEVIVSLNRKELKVYNDINLSTVIIACLFPISFHIEQFELKLALINMLTRLETLEEHGETEVISLQVITSEEILLRNIDMGVIYSFSDIEELIELLI